MTRPNRRPGGSREMTCSMSYANYDRLSAHAAKLGISRAEVLERALERYLAVEELRQASGGPMSELVDRVWQLP